MADDRMWLVCKACGEAFCIGKTYAYQGYFSTRDPEDYFRKLMGFFDRHEECVTDDGKPATQTFELIYESDDKFNKIEKFYK